MTDSDNTQPQDAERRQLARALHLPDGLPFASLIAGAEEQRIDLAAVRAAHESRRRTLSGALNLGTSAPWDAITERAGTVQAAASERADTAEAALTRVREAAFDAERRPDRRLSQIRNLLDPADPDRAALDGDQPNEAEADDDTCTCGHGAGSAHDIDNSIEAFTACVVPGCGCKRFLPAAVVREQPAARLSHDEIVQRLLDAARPHLARALGFVQDGQR